MMSSRVIIDESAKRILEESIYSGTKYINTTEEIDVAGYANAQVSGSDTIVQGNIKKDVTILGVEGSYEGTPTKQYIYEKGEDSDVEFYLTLFDGSEIISEGTNLTVNARYDIHTDSEISCDFYVNDIYVGTDFLIAFTLSEDMSVNNRVVITVKRHEGGATLTLVDNNLMATHTTWKITDEAGEVIIEETVSSGVEFQIPFDSLPNHFRIQMSNGVSLNSCHFTGDIYETHISNINCTYGTDPETLQLSIKTPFYPGFPESSYRWSKADLNGDCRIEITL